MKKVSLKKGKNAGWQPLMRCAKNNLYIIMVIFVVSSCVPEKNAIFTIPQPDGLPVQDGFKGKFLGTFLCLSDNASILRVDKNMVIMESKWKVRMSKGELDTSREFKIVNNKLYCFGAEEGVDYNIINDTIIAYLPWSDTIFKISEDNVLKYFKGYQFLNIRHGDMWEVKIMGINENKELELKTISIDEDIKNLKDITNVEEIKCDSSDEICGYKLKPTKGELKNFLKQGGFADTERFIRIKKR